MTFSRFVLCLGLLGCRPHRPARAPSPVVAAATPAQTTRCTSPAAGAPTSWELASRTLHREGSVLRDPQPGRDGVTLVALGGPHGDTEAPDAALGRLGQKITEAHPQAVFVIGGLDGDVTALGAWFRAVIPRDVPALLVPADTEDVGAFRALARGLAETHPGVVDATQVRLYASESVEVVIVPGVTGDALVRREGAPCVLAEDDLAAFTALPPAQTTRVVVSALAPRQEGRDAIDRGAFGVHVGSEALARLAVQLAPRATVALIPRESAGGIATASDGRVTLSVGTGGRVPFETAGGALVGPRAWALRVGGERIRVEAIEP